MVKHNLITWTENILVPYMATAADAILINPAHSVPFLHGPKTYFYTFYFLDFIIYILLGCNCLFWFCSLIL